jgi:peptide/nickel transport system substrate-binding protein
MPAISRCCVTFLGICLVLSGCAPRSEVPAAPNDRVAAPKRIVVAIMGDPPTLYNKLNQNNSVPGVDALEELVHVGLSHADRFGVRGARLAQEVPSVENGLWQVSPDGSMELTWRIRPEAEWHDGAPVTSADLLFTSQLERDPELAVMNNRLYDGIESIETPDAQTIAVRWKRPYINADEMFSYRFASPLPRHILEEPYNERKAALLEDPYWTTNYVGAGPYRLRDFVAGSHLLLEANDRYIMGRPKVDVIEVRFLLDSNAMLASILAGAIDVTLGRTVSLDQAVQIRDAWQDGQIEVGYKSWLVLYPQFLDPTPAVVTDVRFRRALMHAVDRQQLADTLMAGLSTVAHNYLNPQEPEYNETLSAPWRNWL